MSRKKNTILIFNNIPVHKGANQVPFSLLFNHEELFKDVFFILSRKAVPPSILEMIHYPHRGRYLAHVVSAGTGSISSQKED